MLIEDTIAAISTPVGQGGIGIVRLSGTEAVKIADKIFITPKKKKLSETPSHRILFGFIKDPYTKETIDEVLVSVMKSPNTYTREDIVEINCHGGAVPMKRVLELILERGARLARPGEFTQRAFLNGRIDLTQAEAALDVINAMTVESQKSAVRQLRGRLSGKFESIREKLTELAAFVEAYIDFPDEDIDQPSSGEMEEMALSIKCSLGDLIESSRYGIILRDGIKTAIIGRPNVGKSSLLNALLEHDRAIVTETPGTTRDIIEEYLNINGLPVRIIDTAGIRSVEEHAEKEGVRRSLTAMREADLVLLVIDGSMALQKRDIELINRSDPDNTIFVINKSDLAHITTPPTISDLLKGHRGAIHAVSISAKKDEGLADLKTRILETALEGYSNSSSGIITNTRHLNALERSLSSMDSFIDGVKANTSPEFLSLELREALDAIGEIIGTTTPDDILNKIFSSFCIGK